MISVRKRMAGLVDMDTIEDVMDDFDFSLYPGTSEEYETTIMNQILYMINIINKKGSLQVQ